MRNVAKRRAKNCTKVSKFKRHLDEVDWTIIDVLMREPGISDNELAKKLGYSRHGITRRRRNPAVQFEIAELKRDEISRTRDLIHKALSRAGKILDHGKDSDAKSIAMKLINGLPEIATGVLKPEHDRGDEPTDEEIAALQEYQEETAKRQATDNG